LDDRPATGERAVLVHLYLPADEDREDLSEFTELASSAGATLVATLTATRASPDPKYFVGSGKAGEIRDCVQMEQADLVLFNHTLSPSQERNLEHLLGCRVLDRTGLILDIFAQRARSFEGKLQVELAQLRYLSTRLVRAWTHLERQKGGIGLRGPGETQLETDRRLINLRIKTINRRLEKVRRQRQQGRRARSRADLPAVSLVGYTNAGKSTLFSQLTTGDVYIADQLFATLDSSLRRVEVPKLGPLVLADTVGFIRHLPTDLVAAFRSTLEETQAADLLLHIIDVAAEGSDERVEQVNEVLQAIGASDVPQLEVYNKIDQIDKEPCLERDNSGRIARVWICAATGAGLGLLKEAIADRLCARWVDGWVYLPPSAGRMRARLYELGSVKEEQTDRRGGWWIAVRLAAQDLDRLRRDERLECPLYPTANNEYLAGVARGT